jgi:PAS domain S-box-containing protein
MGYTTLPDRSSERRNPLRRLRQTAGRCAALRHSGLLTVASDVRLFLVAAAAAAIVFAADLMLPLGVGIGVLYTAVVLLSLWSSRRNFALIAALTGSILIILGFFKAPGDEPLSTAAMNRLVALAVVWLTALLLPSYQLWRARAEETRAHLAALVESCADAIISKTLDGEVKSWNKGAERLFGYAAQEVLGSKISILIPPDCLNEEPEFIEKLRRGERIEHFETVRQRKDGKRIDVSLTLSPVIDTTGTIIGISTIAQDIAERKQSEEERDNLLLKLVDALEQIKHLQGMLPICAACHKIRNDEGYWDCLETYFQEHSDLKFTHGLCPQCLDQLYPTLS